MAVDAGIFGGGTNFNARFVTDKRRLKKIVAFAQSEGMRIVLTSGSWDLVHLGHLIYLATAKAYGDLLIVGVDSDQKIRKRKGPKRPVVPHQERLHILAHCRPVDVLVLKKHTDPKHDLLKRVHPDILVISKTSGHDDGSVEEMQKYCGEIKLLEPQAETSTSARVRLLHTGGMEDLFKRLQEGLPGFLEQEFKALMEGDD